MKIKEAIILTVVLLSFIQVLNAQTIEQDTILAKKYFQKADSLMKVEEYEISDEYFEKARDLYEKH